MPRRVSTAQVDSTASCRLHVDTTLATRDYGNEALRKKGSLALSLIRSSGETRAHRSPSARPAFLTVCRLLYSADSFHSASPAEFCSAYVSPDFPTKSLARRKRRAFFCTRISSAAGAAGELKQHKKEPNMANRNTNPGSGKNADKMRIHVGIILTPLIPRLRCGRNSKKSM